MQHSEVHNHAGENQPHAVAMVTSTSSGKRNRTSQRPDETNTDCKEMNKRQTNKQHKFSAGV